MLLVSFRSPGNVEKAMGSIVKSGNVPITGVLAPGEKLKTRGLTYAATVGWELFHLMLNVASGRKKTWAEHWKLHNALVLFNPAPVT